MNQYPNTYHQLYTGNALDVLKTLPENSIHCCITSPPYWGIRDYSIEPSLWDGDSTCKHEWNVSRAIPPTNNAKYGGDNRNICVKVAGNGRAPEAYHCTKCNGWLGCLGFEATVSKYVDHLTQILDEVKRVLRKDGTLWLVLGDCYAGSGGPGGDFRDGKKGDTYLRSYNRNTEGLKPKDLVGVPWRVALALQEKGWYLRKDIIWSKPSSVPDPVHDRPTSSHEYIFLLSKAPIYFFDIYAYSTTTKPGSIRRGQSVYNSRKAKEINTLTHRKSLPIGIRIPKPYSNLRSVWTIQPSCINDAHPAPFPSALVLPCLQAATSEYGCCTICTTQYKREVILGKNELFIPSKISFKWHKQCQCDTEILCKPIVLDPFGGAGTVSIVAKGLGINSIYIDASKEYTQLTYKRLNDGNIFNDTQIKLMENYITQ